MLLDEEGVRAPVIAGWLRQLGHEACVLEGGVAAAAANGLAARALARRRRRLRLMTVRAELADALRQGRAQVIDLRPGHDLPQGPHPAGALVDPAAHRRGRRGHLARPSRSSPTSRQWRRSQRSISPRPAAATSGCSQAATRPGAPPACRSSPRPTIRADADCIDFLFFTHGRHDGNAEAARQYLAWEIGLIDQLDAQERGVFRIPQPDAAGSATSP